MKVPFNDVEPTFNDVERTSSDVERTFNDAERNFLLGKSTFFLITCSCDIENGLMIVFLPQILRKFT